MAIVILPILEIFVRYMIYHMIAHKSLRLLVEIV